MWWVDTDGMSIKLDGLQLSERFQDPRMAHSMQKCLTRRWLMSGGKEKIFADSKKRSVQKHIDIMKAAGLKTSVVEAIEGQGFAQMGSMNFSVLSWNAAGFPWRQSER